MGDVGAPTELPEATEVELLELTQRQLRSLFPPTWRFQLADRGIEPAADAVIEVRDPSGAFLRLLVEVKRSLLGRDVERLSARVRQLAAAVGPDTVPVVVSRYLSEPVQQALTARGVNYVDATGNVRLQWQRPAVFVRNVGAANDPWRRRGRPRGSLRGQPAALVVRALVDYRPPYSVPELVRLSGSSNGATYRVVEFLHEQALLRREQNGRVVEVSWRALLETWSRDYSFYTTNPVTGFLAPRGIARVIDALRSMEPAVTPDLDTVPGALPPAAGEDPDAPWPRVRYAISGSFAASAFAPYAPTRTLTLYTNSRDQLGRRLGLRPVDAGANVLVAEAAYDVVFRNPISWQGVWVTAPSQTAVDLMTGPGRNPVEARELLEWMERNESEWRLVAS